MNGRPQGYCRANEAQVRGLCVDLSNLDIFERVNVYGDITDCEIHHMWYGIYR